MKSWHQSKSFQYLKANTCIICFTFTCMFCVLFRDTRSLFASIASIEEIFTTTLGFNKKRQICATQVHKYIKRCNV